MYVWRFRGRRDRRANASTALETLDDHDLEFLRKKEIQTRADEEVDRFMMEKREIEKFKNFVREDLEMYFETRFGKDEISAVGSELMEERALKEKEEAAKRKANGEADGDDDDDTYASALSTSAMDKHKKKKKKKKKEKGSDESRDGGSMGDNNNIEGDNSAVIEDEKKEENIDNASKKNFFFSHSSSNTSKGGRSKGGKSSKTGEPELDPMSMEAILQLDPKELSKEQAMKLKVYHVFEMFDADAGGTINEEEFRNCIDELCIPMDDDELKTVMKEVDGDESGEIEFEEFFGWYDKNAKSAGKGKMMGSMALKFAKAMRNYNGESVREEAKRLILACAEREIALKTKKTFRRSRPPRYVCEVCDEAFESNDKMWVHKNNGKEIHAKWREEMAATLERQRPVITVLSGPAARKWKVRRLVHSQHLYDAELDGITLDDINVWRNKNRPFIADPTDKRGDQLRRGQLVEGFDAKMGKRAGFVQRGFVLRDLRPGEGRTRNHMACNPQLLPDVLLRLYMDKKPYVTKAVRKRAKKKGIALPLDTTENTFLCDPANGQSKALCSFAWGGLVYQGAYVHGEFNGYRGELMESQGHVSKTGESEFVLERHLSPGVYQYYFVVDGRMKVDMTKPVVGKGKNKRNLITVCNPSILGGQGGPYTDGRMQSKNLDALKKTGGDVSFLLENSPIDQESKLIRSREASRAGRPSSTDGQHRLNALLAPDGEGMSKRFNMRGGNKLDKVELVHNLVCDDGSWALAEALYDNHRVTYLNLSSNLITSDGMQHLSRMLEKNSSITKLFLNANSIGYDGAHCLATAFVNNDEIRIRELEFADNCLGDDGAEALCFGLAGCGTLTSCNLDGNRIHDDGAAAVGDMLAHNKVLTNLSLAYNLIQKDGAYKLGEALQRNCTLQFLNLNRNPLGPGGLAHICTMLRQNDTIRTLSVGYAKVLSEQGVQGLFELCKMLRINRSLTSLDLSGNDFGESDLRKLLSALHDLDNPSVWTRKRNIALFDLLLFDNSFDGEWMQKDTMVVRDGFPSLPSIPLYCKENMDTVDRLSEEEKYNMRYWLQMKKNKRRDAEKRKKERREQMKARVEQQQREQKEKEMLENPLPTGIDGEGRGGKRKKKKKKKALASIPDELGDMASVSSLGSTEFLKGSSSNGKGNLNLSLIDEDTVASSLSEVYIDGGGGHKSGYKRGSASASLDDSSFTTFEGSSNFDDFSFGQDANSVAQASITDATAFGFDVDENSLGPSIDSAFLASMRSNLFSNSSIISSNDSNATPNATLTKAQREKLLLFRNSGMYDEPGGAEADSYFDAGSKGQSSQVTNIHSSLGSLHSDETSVVTSSTSSTSVFSKDTAASMLVDRAAQEEQLARTAAEIKQIQVDSSFLVANGGKPPIHPSLKKKVLGFNDLNIDDNASVKNSDALIQSSDGSTIQANGSSQEPSEKPVKIYSREEGEWRKDRTWISQRSLDRTARRIAEEKARNVQRERQKEEDEFIAGKVNEREIVMDTYFKSIEGKLMIDAVVDELKDLRKEDNAAKQDQLNEIRRKDLIDHTDNYTTEKLKFEVRKIFDIFDADNSGQIGCDEMTDLLKELCIPMTRKEVKALVNELDEDKSGELDFEEFFLWYKANHQEQKATGGFVEGMKLKAKSFVNAKLGSTAQTEARRILLSNEMKDVISLARHEFRQKRKPRFECMECHVAFIDKKTKKAHDKDIETIHEEYYLLHERAKARHKLVDLARYRVTKGESYPKFFIYPEDIPDHIELQVYSIPDASVGRPLGVINKNSTVKALKRSGEKGTGDWLQITYKIFEEAWVQEKSRRPLKIHLEPMKTGLEADVEEEKRKMKLALAGKKDDKMPTPEKPKKKKKVQMPVEGGEEGETVEVEVDDLDDNDADAWPRKGHLEFFSVPRWYSSSPKLCGKGLELNVRAQPELTSPVIGFIIDTEAVKCSATFGDWIQVGFKSYDNAWMLIRNKVHDLLKPVPREMAERATVAKRSPWDWTYDYVLNKATTDHITAGSRDALGNEAFQEEQASKKSTSTKAALGANDQLTDDTI